MSSICMLKFVFWSSLVTITKTHTPLDSWLRNTTCYYLHPSQYCHEVILFRRKIRSKRERPDMTSSWELEEVKVQTLLSLLVGMFFVKSLKHGNISSKRQKLCQSITERENLRTRGLFLLSSALYPGLSNKMQIPAIDNKIEKCFLCRISNQLQFYLKTWVCRASCEYITGLYCHQLDELTSISSVHLIVLSLGTVPQIRQLLLTMFIPIVMLAGQQSCHLGFCMVM